MSRNTSSGAAQRAAKAYTQNCGTAGRFGELPGKHQPRRDPPPRSGKPPALKLPGIHDRPNFEGDTSP